MSLRSLLSVAALALACARPPPPPPPPPDPPTPVTLPPERFRRGETPPAQGVDTDAPQGRVRAALLTERTRLRGCYERVLPASPDAAGRVTLTFTVETSGVLTDVEGEADEPALRPTRECILAIVRPMRIEGLRHAVAVRYPLVFENPPVRLAVPAFAITPRARFAPPESAVAAVQAGRGDLTEPEARAGVEPRLGEVQACYVTLLRTARRAEGQVFFEASFAADGSLADVPVAQIPDALLPMRECLVGIVRSLRMRDTRRRAAVTYTFTFQPREPTPAR